MASSSGNSSGSGTLRNSGSEEDLQSLMDQRKRKRMESNRESARRSRLRKQKHLDDLKEQVAHLQNENAQFFSSISLTTRNYAEIEGQNSILRSQMAELTQTLQYLNGILDSVNYNGASTTELFPFQHLGGFCDGVYGGMGWSSVVNSQQFPIMAAAEMMFDY